MKIGAFGSEKAHEAVKQCSPAQWWSIIGVVEAPNLTNLAMHILSQTVSSSNCERNWTTFSMIHTKLRNRIKMENLEKLVYVHYNMRLRAKNLRQRDTEDHLIDLDYIFHEEDPLAEWTTEIEPPLLDDDPWLTDTLNDAIAAADGIPTRATTSQSNENSSGSSNDDQGNVGGSGVGLTSNYGIGSNYGDDSRRFAQTYSRRDASDIPNRRDRNLNVEHGHQHNYEHYNPYISNDPPNYRHSTSDYTSGNSYYGTNETYSDISSDQNSQFTYATQSAEPSPFDNMMETFMGSGQIQYGYPSYYATHDIEES